jgi:glutamine cyclotransferase
VSPTHRRTRRVLAGLLCALALTAAACSDDSAPAAAGSSSSAPAAAATDGTAPADCPTGVPQRLAPQVVRTLPHATDAFTEGLVLADGVLYESTGLVGKSEVKAIDPTTGAVRSSVAADPSVFAEGLAMTDGGQLVQLTWKDGIAYRRDPATLQPVGRSTYQGEGWGLATLDDGTLVMSDGTDRITERDPTDFRVTDRWTVARAGGGGTDQLNELDWDGTHLWANRWQTDEIVRIDRRCRRIDAVVDGSPLVRTATAAAAAAGTQVDVLNGIAHVPGTDRYLVTGKYWPEIFEVRFVPA